MQLTKATAEQIVKSFGGFVESDPSTRTAEAFAPRDFVWKSSECSSIIISYQHGGTMRDVWEDLIAEVKEGIEEAPEGIDDAWWID